MVKSTDGSFNPAKQMTRGDAAIPVSDVHEDMVRRDDMSDIGNSSERVRNINVEEATDGRSGNGADRL